MTKRRAVPVLDVVVDGLPEVEGGKFRVMRDGTVYRRRKDDSWEYAPQCGAAKNKNYMFVSFTEKGKQTHYLVHRLVATAYIPNPGEKREVNHKDGNPRNNCVENLEWATRSENYQHAVNGGLVASKATAGKPCIVCGENIVLRTNTCPICKAKAKADDARKNRLAERKQISLEIVDTANMRGATLDERQIEIMRMLSEGKPYQEIGDRFGITRERVRQIIHQVRVGRHNSGITKQQKEIATHIRLMGIKMTTISLATGIEYGRVTRLISLKSGMDDSERRAIQKFLGIEDGTHEPKIVEFDRMPLGIVRRG